MKTTVELPDEIFRRAKAEAALRGIKFKDLVAQGLRLVLETPRTEPEKPTLEALMQPSRGVVASGLPDLASNPEHMAGFGRDANSDR